MIALTGLESYIKRLRAARPALDVKVTQAYRNFVEEVFTDIVKNTPQFSGDTASNWKIVFGKWGSTYEPYPGKGNTPYDDAKQRGHETAVNHALERNLYRLPTLRWNQKVRIVNETPITSDLENERVYIRPVNLVNGKVQMVAYAKAKYSARIKQI